MSSSRLIYLFTFIIKFMLMRCAPKPPTQIGAFGPVETTGGRRWVMDMEESIIDSEIL